MTLREIIKEMPEALDLPIIMSSDAEGNNYSPLSSYWVGNYAPNNTWSGEVGLAKLTEELEEQGYSEEDIIEGELSLILGPVN